ncbi:D-alanyl-D-alanine carboxypeptidase [Streptomyces formicae]|uniref:serine-type D-Ala-D-Ala carboxypeptidase n=1 Tax=Streptomyces formicae TaxID=1616117 RepID=A0A291QAI1_9ACTN|nr:D-alanyl-D-alanine carboxypeptidase [Streptomyces formicae]
MAGETPDRSEQRKSSGNPTAESSAPTPEERDPRLAVARDTPSAREDRATAVFSTKAVTEDDSSSEEAGGPANGDARLRAAVAAWVAGDEPDGDSGRGNDSADAGVSAVEEGGSSGAAASTGDGAGASATGGAAPAEGDGTLIMGGAASAKGDDATSAAGDGDAASATGGASGKADGADGSGISDEPGKGDASGRTDAAGAGDASGSGDVPGQGDASGKADVPAKGAEFGDGDVSGKGNVSGSGDVPGQGDASGKADVSVKDAEFGGDDVSGKADAPAKNDAPGKGGTYGKGNASGTAEAPGAADAAGKTGASAKSDAPGKGEAPGKVGASAAADAPANGDAPGNDDVSGKSEASAKSEAPGKSNASGKADAPAKADASAKSSAPGKGDAPAKADASAKADAPAKGSAPATSEAPGKGDASAKADAPAVDQATAVFKALSPKSGDKSAGQGVDQATTMLKLSDLASPEKGEGKGSGPADGDRAKPNAKGAAKAEGEAERTSKFVALKPLDAPAGKPAAKAEPKPAPAAPAKGTGATAATPDGPPAPPPVERTTQQPLPPKPPIDLLAELTNTPPPPETPVRTAVRRVKIWTPLVLLLVVVFAVVQAVRPLPTPTLELTARETVSFEGGKPSVPWPGEGQAAMDVNGIGTFGTSGEQKPVPIASIAKVMTVYLILRDHPLKKGEDGPKIPVDAAAQKHYETGKPANESVVKVTEGQKLSEYEALQAVMLPSANNVAKLLARWDTKSNSEDEFVAKMNKTAKELGMKNTHYTDPSGLDKTTVSTAEDLVKLGRAAMENPVFNEISRQPSYTDLNGDKQKNFFGLIPTVAIGIKTGTTTAAGGNILFAAEKVIDGKRQTIIGATLGQYGDNGVANIDEVTRVTKELIEAGQGALKSKTIVKKGDVVGQVDDGLGGTTPVVATKDVAAVGWSGLTVKLELDAEKGKTLPNSAKAGTKVGVLSVGDGKGSAVEVPVALQKDLAEPSFGAKLTRVG